MSSSIDGLPDPASYTAGSLPRGITNPINVSPPASPAAQPQVQNEYALLQQDDTAELLHASFLSPSAGLRNADEVLAQATALLDTPGTAGSATTASTAGSGTTSTNATGSSTGTGGTSSSSSAPTTADDANLPSYQDLISQSDAAANAVLSSYANAPAGSSIIDYQA